jgi:hypothetical protein
MATMSIMLPSELDWVLDMLGYSWPNIDEDKLLACAQAWRDFAADCSEAESAGSTAANAVVLANSGEAIEKFSEAWGKFSGGFGHDSYLVDARVASEVIAGAFDAAAMAVIAGKIAVIAQLIALAVEVIAAQAAAPFTFGLSEAGALGATQATRLIVRRLLDKLKKEVMEAAAKAAEHATMDAVKKMVKDFAKHELKDYVKNYVKDTVKETVVDGAKDKAKEALTDMATDLEQQAIKQHFGAQDGFDLGETANIAKEKAGEYVDDVTGLADPATHWDNLKGKPQEYVEGRIDNAAERAGNWASGHMNPATGDQPDPLADVSTQPAYIDPDEGPAGHTYPRPTAPTPSNPEAAAHMQADFG